MGRTNWTRQEIRFAAAVVVVTLLGLWFIFNRGPGTEAARWRLDPSFTPTPGRTEIPVLVQEASCAERIELSVRYSSSAVTIDIRVMPTGVDMSDQGGQCYEVPYTVKLREPLGQRDLVDANAPTP